MTRITATLILCIGMNAALSITKQAARASDLVLREVLVLTEEGDEIARGETAERAVEACLQRLGLLVRYWSVQKGPPPDSYLQGAAAIVSLVQQPVQTNPETLVEALVKWQTLGRPLMLLAGIDGLASDLTGTAVPSDVLDPLLRHLNVRIRSEETKGALFWSEHHWNWFEIPNGRPRADWPGLESLSPASDIVAAVRESNGPDVPVAILGPTGAYLSRLDVLLEQNPVSFRYRWRFDPYRFFENILHCAGQPVPDVSTVNGQRVFFAHVDGDGFANRAIDPRGRIAAEVLHDEVLTHLKLPTTVSIIARDLVGKPQLSRVARRIFALPHIEAASHSYTHPHDWLKGIGTPMGMVADWGEALEKGRSETLEPTREIDDSLAVVQSLLPANKRPAMILWSGLTNPPERFLARARHCGVANMNGGDAMINPDAPSIACGAPFADRVGEHWQVFSAAANENLFTNQWSGPFNWHAQLLKQFQLTEYPRRLSAANLYYHFYAAERPAGLRTLQAVYDWASRSPLTYLSASHYARNVDGFITARWQTPQNGEWRLTNWGECRTARFDDPPGAVDLVRSEGVAGYCRGPQCLYVHLTGPDASIVFSRTPARQPYLLKANAPLIAWQVTSTAIVAEFQAYAPLRVELAGFSPHQSLRMEGHVGGLQQADERGEVRLHARAGRVKWQVSW